MYSGGELMIKWVANKQIHLSAEATEKGSFEMFVHMVSKFKPLLMKLSCGKLNTVRKKKCNYISRVMLLCQNLWHSCEHLLLLFTVLGWVNTLNRKDWPLPTERGPKQEAIAACEGPRSLAALSNQSLPFRGFRLIGNHWVGLLKIESH